MRKHLGAFAMEVISSCAYGIDLDAVNNPDHPIMVNAKKVLSVDTSPTQLLSILFPKVASLLRLNFFDVNAINYFDQLFNEIVKYRRGLVKQQNGHGNF